MIDQRSPRGVYRACIDFTKTLAVAVLLAAAAPALLKADSVVVFNEIMYHPDGDETRLEWIELHNQMGVDVDLSGWSLCDGVQYLFPPGTIIPAHGYLVVAASPAALEAETGFAGALGPFSGRLENSGERLSVCSNTFRVMDTVRYRDEDDWPVAPDGSGVSLAKLDPQLGSEEAANWAPSREIGGTPGRVNFPVRGGGPSVPEGLVSWWRFEGTGSTARDSVGPNHGTLGSGATRVAGLVGDGAVRFDNSPNAFVNLGAGAGDSFATSEGIAIEAVIVPAWSGSPGDYDDIFRKEDGPRRIVFAFQHDANENTRDVPISPVQQPVLSFGINVGGVYSELDMPLDGRDGRPALSQLKDGRPHHVAASYDAATGRKAIYVDGRLAFSAELGAGKLVSSGGGSTAYIGNMSGRGEPFNGVIDEVAFWRRGLTAEEAASHAARALEGRDYFSGGGEAEEGVRIAINEVAETGGGTGWIELFNPGPREVNLAGLVIRNAGMGAGEFVLAGGVLSPGGYEVLAEGDLGFPLVPGNRIFVYDASRTRVLEAIEVKAGLRGRHPEGTGPFLWPSEPTPGAANRFEFRDEIVINEIMYHHRPEQAVPAVTEDTLLVPIDAVWRYDVSGSVPAPWKDPDFDDSSWPSGRALLYHEESALPAPKNTEIPLGPIAFYFRHEFEFAGDPGAVELSIRPIVDDGAVFYLNGVEVHRLNMPAGAITPSTQAAIGVGNADFRGPFVISSAPLRAGRNVLAVEVHQATPGSSDVVFGMELTASVELRPALPFRESREAWIELYNRSASTSVDLTGWRITGGIDFAFPAGTVLAAGEYLVVAADRDVLAQVFPGRRILGNFLGRLSHRSDRIVLRDALGNPADEVRYYDGGWWPEYADGGGSSLELRDPRADNSRPQAWAASDEARRSEWKTYTYRDIARPYPGPTQWREFVFGLLDAGECLVDDIRVVEDPGGAAVELVTNGDFENGEAGWRIIGNHRHSRVVPDPGDPANHVLHLVATGPTEHMHNHIETTLAGGRQVVNGREYLVTFRAKWLAGSNQFHTRLYFNRVPRTTLLDVPLQAGTPGEPNSKFEGNIGPTFADLRHSPVVPGPGEEVEVSVTASDPDGISEMTLWYSVEEGPWTAVAMEETAPGVYRAAIPGQAAGRVVQFYVEGEDGSGVRAAFPPRGRDSRALYKVDDGQADLSLVHNFRIVMTPSDIAFLHEPTNVMSNDRLPATVIYDERLAFYDAGVRLKGSERGRNQPGRVGFNVRFHPDNLFRGVHRTVAVDRSGGYSTGITNGQDEILVKHMIAHAGDLPAMYDDLIRVIAPRSAQTGPALLQMARYNDVFLESQFANGDEGTVFEFELIYYPLTTAPNGLKLPEPDSVMGVDLSDLGDDKEAYRWNFLITNNRDRDDYESLIPFLKAMSLSGEALEARIPDLMDVDEWMRVMVMMALCGVGDVYSFGNNHNLRLYVRPEDGRVLAFPWDWDFSFVQSPGAQLVGNQNIRKVILRPPFFHLFYGHVLDITSTTFNTAYMSRWTDHYGTRAGRSYAGFLTYIGQRRSNALAQLPRRVDFEITTNDGADFTVDGPSAVLEGNGWVDVRTIVVSELDTAFEPDWPGLTRWEITVPVGPGANPLTLLALDRNGNPVGSDTITITSTFNPPVPVLEGVTPAEAFPGDLVEVRGRDFLAGIDVLFDTIASEEVTVLDSTRLSARVPDIDPGDVFLRARNRGGDLSNALPFTVLAPLPVFIRGDANLDRSVDVSDAVRILVYLFRGVPIDCLEAADADGNAAVELTDAVYLLSFLFRGGPPPAAPFPLPGRAAGPLGCERGL